MTPMSPSDANLALLQMDQHSLVQKKLDMDALRERLNGKPDQKAKLREACEGFESLFVQKLWEQMRKNVQKSGYLHSRDEQTYQSLYDVEFSKKMTQAGGIGLADMLYEQLSQRLGQASRSASPRNDPRLPISPAGSSVSALSGRPLPLENEAPQAGIPLNNKKIRPLYEELPAAQPAAPPAAPAEAAAAQPVAAQNEAQNLAAFTEEAAPPAAQAQPQAGPPAADDFEALSQALLAAEAAEASTAPQAVPVADASPLSPAEAALISAALRQSEAAALRFGTGLATDPANPAESAAVSHMNNLPRS